MSRKFLAVLLGVILLFSVSYAQVQTKFKDIPSNHWAAEAVKALSDLGIIAGIRPDTYGGDLYLTRYQAAVLLYKVIQTFNLEEIALSAEDIAELKELVMELSGELEMMGVNIEDLNLVLEDLDSRVSNLEVAIEEKVSVEDVEAMIATSFEDLDVRVSTLEDKVDELSEQIASFEKVEVTPEQIAAVIGEKFEATVQEKVEETLGDLTFRVDDLEGFVTDLDSRVADVEAALIDKPSIDEVEAMIEEKLGSAEMFDISELVGRVDDLESRAGDMEARLDAVDSGISDVFTALDDINANLTELAERVDDLSTLEDKMAELSAKVEGIQGIEVPAELEDINAFILDLDAKVSDLSVEIEDINTALSDMQSQIDAVNARVDEAEANIENANISIEALSTSVDDLYVLNDDLAGKVSELGEGLTEVNSKVTDLENKLLKNFSVTLQFGATKEFSSSTNIIATDAYVRAISMTLNDLDFGISSLTLKYDKYGSFAPDNYGLVVDLPSFDITASAVIKGFTISGGVAGGDGTAEDKIAANLSGAAGNINYNVYGVLGRKKLPATAYDYGPVGADISMKVSDGITAFADGYYNNASFAVLAGATLDNLIPNSSLTVKGVYKGTFGVYAELGTTLMSKLDASVIVDVPNVGKIDKDNVSVTLYGAYSINDRLSVWGYATNNESGMWYGCTLDSTVASAAYVEADYVPVSGITFALSTYKSALPTITSNPLPDFVSFSTKVKF
ncbi:MAG: S-layer homology domain-containing protein [Dictyoglomaceae bacterium]